MGQLAAFPEDPDALAEAHEVPVLGRPPSCPGRDAIANLHAEVLPIHCFPFNTEPLMSARNATSH